MGVATANALLGAVASGIAAGIGGRPILQAAAAGALGGVVGFAGKRLAAERGDIALMAGRFVHGIGNSVIANAARGTGILDTLHVPVAFAYFRFSPARPGRFRATINVHDVVAVIYYATKDGVRFSPDRSIRALTPVFVTDELLKAKGATAYGATTGSLMVLSRAAPNMEAVFRHEFTHVLQNDFVQVVWEDPLERSLRRRIPMGDQVPEWLSVGALVPLSFQLFDRLVGDGAPIARLKELEAERLERR